MRQSTTARLLAIAAVAMSALASSAGKFFATAVAAAAVAAADVALSLGVKDQMHRQSLIIKVGVSTDDIAHTWHRAAQGVCQ